MVIHGLEVVCDMICGSKVSLTDASETKLVSISSQSQTKTFLTSVALSIDQFW